MAASVNRDPASMSRHLFRALRAPDSQVFELGCVDDGGIESQLLAPRLDLDLHWREAIQDAASRETVLSAFQLPPWEDRAGHSSPTYPTEST